MLTKNNSNSNNNNNDNSNNNNFLIDPFLEVAEGEGEEGFEDSS